MAGLISYDYIRKKALADPDSGEAIVYLQDIADAPTVDAVEVVRCKDCERRIEKRWCYSLHTYNGEPVGVADDFFCAYGKRKSDG